MGQSPHGTTELSYAGGDETTALRKSREGWGTVGSPPGKASIITKYSPGVLPPSFGRTAEQHRQYAEHCRRSRTGNKRMLLSREVVRLHPSLAPSSLPPGLKSDWRIYEVDMAKSKFMLETPQLQSPSTTPTNTYNFNARMASFDSKDENEKCMLVSDL